MRWINGTAAAIVLIANIVVSYNHSIQLFQSGGFTGWMAHVAVIAAEITFIMGALNIVVSRMKAKSPGLPAIAGGFLGIGLVGWSNIAAGWSFGITGFLLGAATPISLIIAESILSRAILQEKEPEVTPELMPEKDNEKVESDEEESPGVISRNQQNTNDEDDSHPVSKPGEIDKNQPEKKPGGRKKTEFTEIEIARLSKIYDQVKEQHGVCGRDRLAQAAGISKHQARQAKMQIEQYKQKREQEATQRKEVAHQ